MTFTSPPDAWLSRITLTNEQRRAFHETYSALANEEYTRRGWSLILSKRPRTKPTILRRALR